MAADSAYQGQSEEMPRNTDKQQNTVSSNIDLFAYDARNGMEMINQPLLMMAGKNADTLYMTEGCYEKANRNKK